MKRVSSPKAGAMMLREGLQLPKLLDVKTNSYSRRWRSVETLDSFGLSRMLEAVGLHLFFLAGHVNTIAFGLGEKSLHKAVQRIAAKVRDLELNCLELTEIANKHFLGIPYIAITAHAFHIQPGWQLLNLAERRLQGSGHEA